MKPFKQFIAENLYFQPGHKVEINMNRFRSGSEPGRQRKNPVTGMVKKVGEHKCLIQLDGPVKIKGKTHTQVHTPYCYLTHCDKN